MPEPIPGRVPEKETMNTKAKTPGRLFRIGEALQDHTDGPVARAEVALEWYASEGCSLFERSSQGGQLEAAERASGAKVECPRCCSVERRVASDCAGARCHLIDTESMLFLGLTPGILPDGRECPRCHGTGVEVRTTHYRSDVEITAQPTGHEVLDHGYEIPLHLMDRVAQVTRWLDTVGEPWRSVLDAYYGPDATTCAQIHPWSMHLSVMPLCASGAELLRRVAPIDGESRMPVLRMCQIAKAAPKGWRLELLEAAYQEADGALWNSLEAFGLRMQA